MLFRPVFLALLIMFSIQNPRAQVPNPDTMVHKIFAVLKNKDEKGFVTLYPNAEQMTKLMGRIMSSLKSQQNQRGRRLPLKQKQRPNHNLNYTT